MKWVFFFATIGLATSSRVSFAQQRVPWTTSHIQGTPEPPLPYVVERMYPNLTFTNPLEVTPIPGTDRLLVAQQWGKLFSFVPGADVDKADEFGDLLAFDPSILQVYALTFHPHFAENRFLFVRTCPQTPGGKNVPNGARIIRFRVTEETPPRLDLASGQVILAWLGGGHGGGNMRFGPDGMMYITTGDASEADPPDPKVTGQDISDLLSSVLRIDVDHPEADRAYSVPKDNPFLAVPKARGEVWAYGLRNPWRMSFDAKSGEMFVGDVGWELWEMIYRIQRGGNYGWSITDGSKHDVRAERLRGPTSILPPLVAHSHEEAASITGGEFYHGTRLPELKGAYVYGDYQMGTFWSLNTEGDKATEHREVCRTSLMPAGFGIGADGELIIVDHSGGGLWRLAKNPLAGKNSDFPRRLSATGLFTTTVEQAPAPGVLPYQIHAPRWADHATAERWVALPDKSGITVAAASKGVVIRDQWAFPAGAVLAKTYSLELERGNPATRRRIETQMLHFDGSLWGTYSYRWNAEQTDAELVPARGDEVAFTVKDKSAPGGELQQPWRFFSRSECARCHNMFDYFAQSFSPLQLDLRTRVAAGRQIDLLTRLGITPDEPKFADPHGTQGSLETRARSYLHVNCSVCHRYNSGGAVPSYMNIEAVLKDANLVDFKPVQGDLALPDARVIARGDPSRSVLLYRMATAGSGHMPYLGGKLLDDRGIILVRDWIAGMAGRLKDVSPETRSQREAEEQMLTRLKAGETGALDPLLTTGSGALSVALAVLDGSLPDQARAQAVAKGSSITDPLRRDLFERFLPESRRRTPLGTTFDPQKLLALKGDAQRGQRIFASLCAACHRANGAGIDFGPELSGIGTKWNRGALLEQILQPSKVIEPQWQLVSISLKNGDTKSGFISARNEHEVMLKLPGGVTEKIPVPQSATTTTARLSLMPEGLLQNLTAEEAADLLDYLTSLTRNTPRTP